MSGILHLIPDTSSQKGFNRTTEKWGGEKNIYTVYKVSTTGEEEKKRNN